jgi:hypothetical protein
LTHKRCCPIKLALSLCLDRCGCLCCALFLEASGGKKGQSTEPSRGQDISDRERAHRPLELLGTRTVLLVCDPGDECQQSTLDTDRTAADRISKLKLRNGLCERPPPEVDVR